MPKLSLLRSDLQKEEEGIWETYEIPGSEVNIECLVARMGNRKHSQEVQKLMQKYLEDNPKSSTPGQRIPVEAMEEIQLRAISKYVLLDWKNVEDDDGNPIPYTPEEGYKVLSNAEFHDFHTWLTITSGQMAKYRREADMDAAKN